MFLERLNKTAVVFVTLLTSHCELFWAAIMDLNWRRYWRIRKFCDNHFLQTTANICMSFIMQTVEEPLVIGILILWKLTLPSRDQRSRELEIQCSLMMLVEVTPRITLPFAAIVVLGDGRLITLLISYNTNSIGFHGGVYDNSPDICNVLEWGWVFHDGLLGFSVDIRRLSTSSRERGNELNSTMSDYVLYFYFASSAQHTATARADRLTILGLGRSNAKNAHIN